MKPAFALDFRDSSLGLLHRTGAGWTEVGAVPLDHPDLPEALGYLRSTALGLSPRGLATKLIIPDDQILYIEVDAPGPDEATRLDQIRAALQGRTPYDVDELAFDWSGSGDRVQVAVIARETLAEAESFAAEHRFNPIAFVAAPQNGGFRGEPWFGPTTLAASLLTEGESVDRDPEPVKAMARSFAAEPAPSEIPQPEPEYQPEPEHQPEPEVPEPDLPEPSEPEPDLPEPDLPAPDLPEPDLPEPEWSEPQIAQQSAVADPSPLSFAETFAATALPPVEETATDKTPAVAQGLAAIEVEEAPMALDVADDGPEEAPAPVAPAARVIDPVIDEELPPALSKAALVAFSSRRQPGDAAPGKSPALGAAAGKPGVPRPAIAKPLPAISATPERPVPPSVPRPAVAAAPPRAQVGKPNQAGKALRGLGALVTAPGIAGGKKAKVTAKPNPTPAPAPSKPNAPPRAGIGLGGKPAPVRGKPRHLGLIMTLVLLLFMAAVAAWSSYSLAFWLDNTPAATDTAATDAEMPGPDDEMLADMQDPEAIAEANTAAQLAGQTDAADPSPAPTEATPNAEIVATEPAPTTGDALIASLGNTPANQPQDEILLATMDAPPNAPDPLALPAADARGDPLPAAQPAPPPFGTVYQFDADGLIRPTPEGIITPEGVLLIAGKPPRVPEPRPAEVVAAASALAPATDAAAPAGTTALPATAELPVNPALIGKRAQPRPEGLVPAAAKPEDDASLAPAVDSRLATLRPQARPTPILAAGEAARLASANASLTAQAEAAALAETAAAATAGRSKMAVAISRKPEARPRDLNKAVEAAVAAAIRAPEPEPEADPVETAAQKPEPDAAPEADNEPEVASTAPSIPTKASVAKQATFKNAINLSKINLIGVYGTQSNRYALIRQANGRFKKVKVGDKIDGGQIAAITASEVRYKKGGRMVALAMPKG